MDYLQQLQYHFKPRKGWINDPNGLVFFDGYYHMFYQHAPDFELPWKQPMHWGHARTRDFLHWEELPVALFPDKPYDRDGCWSGTATVRDGVLYLIYTSYYKPDPSKPSTQTVSVAYSRDGIRFEKYEGNPVIAHYPPDGCHDFRDPALCCHNGQYYCVMASGHEESKTARLLLYKSDDLLRWDYCGVMCEWQSCKYAECPSFMPAGDKFLLTASVCPLDKRHYFSVMYGDFKDGKFTVTHTAEVDKGPDQYAGQVFCDPEGRCILISWMPGWKYQGHASRDVGCMSLPRELKLEGDRITAYPVREVQHLLRDADEAVQRTSDGFVIPREGREPVVFRGDVRELKILRDGYVVEVFVNGGEEVYSALL